MDYEGIYYCVKCGLPKHILRIMEREMCECGNFGFMSCADFNINEVINRYEEDQK
jgi:hypothetical protein